MSLNDFSLAADGVPADVMITPVHMDLRMKPMSDSTPTEIVVPGLKLTALPKAMRRMGWDVSAALMERWFDSPAWQMPESWKRPLAKMPAPKATDINEAQVDDTIVTMDWALCFKRCTQVRSALIAHMETPAAVNELRQCLLKTHWNGRSPHLLGQIGMSARAIDTTCQVNAASFGRPTDTLDDMYGALGSATAKLGLVGEAYFDQASGNAKFHVRASGIYIRDHYDFNGKQFLGLWTERGVVTKKQLILNAALNFHPASWHGEPIGLVTNQNFAAYRDRHGRGGDFMIFSDVKWEYHRGKTIDLGPW